MFLRRLSGHCHWRRHAVPNNSNRCPAWNGTHPRSTNQSTAASAEPQPMCCVERANVLATQCNARSDRGDEACARSRKPVDIKGWNVYVVDAHSLIFQVFHALPEMSSPRGEQVGAVFGFVRDMLYLIEEKKPDALICAFDLSGPTFRDELFDRLQGRTRRNAG